MGGGASKVAVAPVITPPMIPAASAADTEMLRAKFLKVAPAAISARRCMERQRSALEAKYAMFSTLIGKARALKEEKVAQLITVPLPGGGTKRQLVKKIGDELAVGAAFCGRSAILPMLGPTALTSAGAVAAREISEVLVSARCEVAGGRDYFVTPEEVMHVTLFACAPDPPAGEKVDEAVLGAELDTLKELAAPWPAFELEAHRVVLMPSGTILLLWLPLPDTYSDAEATRAEFRSVQDARFPEALGGVPDIFHTSLGRICFGVTLEDDEVAAIEAVCARATAAVAGQRWKFDRLWYVTDSDEAAMVAPPPSLVARAASGLKQSWKAASTVVRNGDVVAVQLNGLTEKECEQQIAL